MQRSRSRLQIVGLGACMLALLAAAAGGAEDPAMAASSTTGAERRVILLPIEYTVTQSGIGHGEGADWTTTARINLSDAATAELTEHLQLTVVPPPSLSDAEAAALREHAALARLACHSDPRYRLHAPREPQHFDLAFGDGLSFLRERAGADYALIVHGSDNKVSGATTAVQFAFGAATGFYFLSMGASGVTVCLLDLRHGAFRWMNAAFAPDIVGLTRLDMRDATRARAVMAKLFADYAPDAESGR